MLKPSHLQLQRGDNKRCDWFDKRIIPPSQPFGWKEETNWQEFSFLVSWACSQPHSQVALVN